MTNYEKIKNMSKDELIDFFVEITESSDFTPWDKWFSGKYCDNCDLIETDNHKFAYCEIYDKCKFFEDYDTSLEFTIKRWLEAEIEE